MSASRARRIAVAVVASLSLILGLAPAASAAGPTLPLPDTMAAVGDSITRAASTGGSLGVDAPQNSWATGTSTTVNSHYLRLLAAGAPIEGRYANNAVSGAKVADLAGQIQTLATIQPDYLTVLIGGNDLCTDTVDLMTSVPTFRAQFLDAMNALYGTGGTAAVSPNTRVYVVSIPNVYQLWNLFKNNFWARFVWSTGDICQSLLANPTSTQAADVQRREAVRQRNVAFNTELASVCSLFPMCHWDGNAVFNTAFTTSDVSADYFHPSVAGQAKLASVTWNAGYAFAADPPPNAPPSAAFTAACTALTCNFADASSDDAGVVRRAWSFGDGATSADVSPSHAYSTAGTYTVSLTVYDAQGLTDIEQQQVTVSAPATASIFVEALTAVAVDTGKTTWAGRATVSVASTAGGTVQGAIASLTWGSASGSCTTDSSGSCSVTTENLNKRKVTSVTFTVTGVTHATLAYDETLDKATSATASR